MQLRQVKLAEELDEAIRIVAHGCGVVRQLARSGWPTTRARRPAPLDIGEGLGPAFIGAMRSAGHVATEVVGIDVGGGSD